MSSAVSLDFSSYFFSQAIMQDLLLSLTFYSMNFYTTSFGENCKTQTCMFRRKIRFSKILKLLKPLVFELCEFMHSYKAGR